MKVNWKVRFKNKAFVASFIGCLVAFVYDMLAIFEVQPQVTQSTVLQVANGVLTILCMMGIVVDPTTQGVDDSKRAMGYEEPWQDE